MDFLQFFVAEVDRLAAAAPGLAPELAGLRERLTQPPRVVLVGRIKAGKSTLLNALVGAPVAETAALEATNVVTVYQYGAPDRAVAVLVDGRRVDVVTRRGEVAELPVPAAQVAYVDRWMTSAAIADYSLVDTPGLATLTGANESVTRDALLKGREETRRAAVGADAAIFLFDSVPREDEVEFLRELGFTPLNTLGVLSRADSFEQGAFGRRDPIDAAREHAGEMGAMLSAYVSRVVPVSGLLAQTAATGAVTEAVAQRLTLVGSRPKAELLSLFLTTSGSSPESHDAASLINLVGEYGLIRGAQYATGGAVELGEWLADRSGIAELRQVLANEIAPYAFQHRISEVMRDIERLAYRHPALAGQIRAMLAYVKGHPAALDANLFAALTSLQQSAASPEIVAEVTRLATVGSMAEKVGLERYDSPWRILDRVRERRAWLQSLYVGLLDPAEEEALVWVQEAYNRIEAYASSLT